MLLDCPTVGRAEGSGDPSLGASESGGLGDALYVVLAMVGGAAGLIWKATEDGVWVISAGGIGLGGGGATGQTWVGWMFRRQVHSKVAQKDSNNLAKMKE